MGISNHSCALRCSHGLCVLCWGGCPSCFYYLQFARMLDLKQPLLIQGPRPQLKSIHLLLTHVDFPRAHNPPPQMTSSMCFIIQLTGVFLRGLGLDPLEVEEEMTAPCPQGAHSLVGDSRCTRAHTARIHTQTRKKQAQD